MHSSILAAAMVAGLANGSIARADAIASTSASASAASSTTRPRSEAAAALATEAFGSLAAQDLDPVGEGIMIGDHARLETSRGPVHVWTPRGYAPETAITIVYVHGYQIDVDEAWWGHGLPEQFGFASINAMFIACEA